MLIHEFRKLPRSKERNVTNRPINNPLLEELFPKTNELTENFNSM